MAFSVTDICNRALQMLGAQAIGSIDEASKNARECKRCYDSLRTGLLAAHPWNFATKFASLPQVVNPPNPIPASFSSNTFVYNLPSDFVRVVAISMFNVSSISSLAAGAWAWDGVNFIQNQDYILQNGVIITWVNPPLDIRYVADFTNANNMDPIFREALAALMAQEMCEMLTQSSSKGQAVTAKFSSIIKEAQKKNAFDKPASDSPEDRWITARH